MSIDKHKQAAAFAALEYIESGCGLGVGTGSTVDFFIEALVKIKHKIEYTIASSIATAQKLQAFNIPVVELNSVDVVTLYVDGADEINHHKQMIKGGGGALTREKIIASNAKNFICIADAKKSVELLGTFPLPIEVIPMARSYVARELIKLGGTPVYRQGVITDNANVILDVHNLRITNPLELEHRINNISGVVCNGIFAQRAADILLLGSAAGVQVF